MTVRAFHYVQFILHYLVSTNSLFLSLFTLPLNECFSLLGKRDVKKVFVSEGQNVKDNNTNFLLHCLPTGSRVVSFSFRSLEFTHFYFFLPRSFVGRKRYCSFFRWTPTQLTSWLAPFLYNPRNNCCFYCQEQIGEMNCIFLIVLAIQRIRYNFLALEWYPHLMLIINLFHEIIKDWSSRSNLRVLNDLTIENQVTLGLVSKGTIDSPRSIQHLSKLC